MECNVTEICSYNIMNPCDTAPPPDPPIGHPLYHRIQQIKLGHDTWKEYSKSCLGIEITTVLPQSETSTILPDISHLVTTGMTEIFRNTTPTHVGQGTDTVSSATVDWVMPVVVTIVCIAIAVVVIVVITTYKTCNNAKNSSGTSHPVELDVHERINYLNNKAEKGEYWQGHQNPGQGDQENLVPPENTVDRNSNQSKDLSVHSENVTENAASVYTHPKYPTIPLPPVLNSVHGQNVTEEMLSNPIYANHQFEKVAKRQRTGADNSAYQVDGQLYKKKAFKEIPTKPIPAPRKNKKVSPSHH